MSFFETLKDATIGFSGYARLGRDPRNGFGYLAVLLAIVVAVNGYITMAGMRRATAELSRQVATLPDFGIKGGEFYFNGPMPHKTQTADGTLVIVDTTGQSTPAALTGQQAILFTREKVHVIQPGSSPSEFAFRRLTNDMSKADLQRFLETRPERFLSFAYLFVYLSQMAFKAIDAGILALIALLYGAIIGRQVAFELGYKLALYAMSLPIIIQWVWGGFHSYTPGGFTLWWSLATIYLIFGLRAYLIAEHPVDPVQG